MKRFLKSCVQYLGPDPNRIWHFLKVKSVSKNSCSPLIPVIYMFRYWNQLNEDIRILLQRFDAEYGDESEKKEKILLATVHR
jgi:hypothetical protein